MIDHRRVHARTIVLLSGAQMLSGLGAGAVLSVGSLLAVELSGSEAWAGSITTTSTLGAAIASMPLARLAATRGRRVALSAGLLLATLGALIAVAAAVTGVFVVLLVAGALLGVGSAVNLQARFAATDLSEPHRRGRDLSLVVWMGTVGAVAGPNLIGAGSALGRTIGVPELSGLFVIGAVGMAGGMCLLWFGLRPDPYLLAAELTGTGSGAPPSISGPAATSRSRDGLRVAWRAVTARPVATAGLIGIVVAHAVMVAVMSMTPLHLDGHGASVTVIGLTISLHIAGMFALAPVMGLATDRFGGRAVVLAGMAILLVAVLVAGLSGHDHRLTTIGLILLGLGWSAATVAGPTMVVAHVAATEKVTVQGLSDTLMSLAGAGGGAASGMIMAATGFAGLGYVAGATVVIASAVIAVIGWRGAPG
ncbi:MAG: MFS transporter [Cellulomonadaceae bacterium]